MDESNYREAEQLLWERTGCAPKERVVRLPRIGTRVRVQEVGTGDPVLFIHGGPNSGATWAPLVAHLDGFSCLLVDRPGTGLSEPYRVTPDNLPSFGASFVGDVLSGMGIDRADVVASSFGGHLALRSSAAEPERIGRMVQMACPALVPGEHPPGFLRVITFGPTRRLLNALPPNHLANRIIMRQMGHGKSLRAGRLPQSFLDWYLALQRHTDTNRSDGEMIAAVLPARPVLELNAELLARVSAPTRFLWGADDTFGDETVARDLVAMMPNADLVMLPASGHLPWLDDPAAIARRVIDFLRRDAARERRDGEEPVTPRVER